jgi:16S rRNA (cytidine1402-2'-O)-methyltransferase
MVFFEARHRIAATLADLATAFGADRPAAVCRELTKTHEEIRRGPLGELAEWATGEVRGELTLVVGGAPAGPADDSVDLAAEVTVREAAGRPRKEAIAEVARERGVPKRTVYDAVLAEKQGARGH